jgi:hypothetical protein
MSRAAMGLPSAFSPKVQHDIRRFKLKSTLARAFQARPFLDSLSMVHYDASVKHGPPHKPYRHRVPLAGSYILRYSSRLLAVVCIALPALLFPSRSQANQINGLMSPHSFLADPAGDEYFISNVNGEPDAKDNNGFITKIDQSGKVAAMKFIQGGQGEVSLHAPKGMALAGRTLYVADLDCLRAFDKTTGRLLESISFASLRSGGQPVSLVDVVYDGAAYLYLSDAEANTIYRVNVGNRHAITVFVHDPVLAGPRGLAIHPKTGRLFVASWHKGKIFEITTDGKVEELISNGFFSRRFNNLEGLDFDSYGNLYIADLTGGKVWRMRPDRKLEVIAEFLPSPADIGIDRRNHLILVPYEYGNAAEMNGLEAPVGSAAKKRRDLSDYGLGWRKKGTEDGR